MTIHLLNCFTCNARFPQKMKTGTLCLIVETDKGPVLVDTGLGTQDYSDPTWFTNKNIRHWSRAAYIPRNIAHNPELSLYETVNSKWYDFDSIRLPFEPEMYFIPLYGHSYGHCGLASKPRPAGIFTSPMRVLTSPTTSRPIGSSASHPSTSSGQAFLFLLSSFILFNPSSAENLSDH